MPSHLGHCPPDYLCHTTKTDSAPPTLDNLQRREEALVSRSVGGSGVCQKSVAASSVAFRALASAFPSSTMLFSSPRPVERNVPVPLNARLARTTAPAHRSSRITGACAEGLRVGWQTVNLNGERCREMYRLHPQTRSWPGRLSRARAPPIGDASSEIDPL
jgi:hypothetical protein